VIRPGSPQWYQTGDLSVSVSFLEIGRSHRVPNKSGGGGVMAAILCLAKNHDGSVRRGVVMVKQPGLFLPKFGATSSHVSTQSPQKSQ
jgi:hypothetical protein